ncbi:hypothetical protein [Vitiosangium sp. GDMCC 1.1324]|uniref:hypothetical protein n=1 Tax=Vitiosangium sp. (strain GDMCC 1.1324) TaxID=2138576 RepID=UPI000D39EF89|nr:hypothetical protein [Vitiosangium sp. GDMCC 1.1324]PTL79110.1 hypothetical protein DAT35_36510 [Vitiosangium sp. GDMCC 1.1324]
MEHNASAPPSEGSSRPALHVRRADLKRNARLKLTFAIFRFCLYGMVGLSSEIFFYNLVRIARHVPVLEMLFRFQWRVDDRLGLNGIWDTPIATAYGQCSLWMFLIYGVACFFFIEAIYRRTFRQNTLLRAVLYGFTILVFEGVSGLFLEKLTGYRIWYYGDSGAIMWEMTSLYILPIWMVTGLIAEFIYRELMDPDLVAALESPLPATPEETEASLQLMQ